MLILYPATWLKAFVSCKLFVLLESLGHFMYRRSANRITLASFYICIPFISFFCIIVAAKPTNTILDILVLFLLLGILSGFPPLALFVHGLGIDSLYHVVA